MSSSLTGQAERCAGGVPSQRHSADDGTTDDDRRQRSTAGEQTEVDLGHGGPQSTRPCGQSATQIIGGGKHRNLMVGVDCVTGPHSQACEYARPDKIILIAAASVFNRAMDFFGGRVNHVTVTAGKRSHVQALAGGVFKARRHHLSIQYVLSSVWPMPIPDH